MNILTTARKAIQSALETEKTGTDLIDAIINRLCAAFGGEPVYWPKIDREARTRAILKDRASGYSLDEIARRNEVSRSTVTVTIKSKRPGIT